MKTGSLARRTVLATLGVLVLALGGFAVLITVRYGDGLRARARSQLFAGASAIAQAPPDQLKPLVASLALEGIDAQIGPGPMTTKREARAKTPLKPGELGTGGHLMTLTEQIQVDGGRGIATLSASEATVDTAVNRLIVTELIAAGAVLAAAALLTLLATRSALRPLRHVGAVAQRIAAGDRRQRLRPRRPETELGRVAASFDAMVESLDGAVAQATRSEAAMRRFLADASHELRTPIAALHSTIETLLREQPPRPRRDQLEAEVARGAQRMGRLVDDLLNLARLEANEPLRSEAVDLVEITEMLAAETRSHARARISITHNGPATALGDPDAIARALRNLLDNAVSAAGAAGSVRVDLQRWPTMVRATISDDGPGVPPEAHERIFQGFVRLNGSSRAGTGLGLAITRAIAHQHRGSVTCEECDAGARFTLELPAVSSAALGSATR